MSNPGRGKNMKIGFIGLGRMGQGMSKRILGDGHDLVVYDVIKAQTAELAAAGVRVASSVAEVCEGREVVITMLAEDTILKDVASGPGGIRGAAPSGAVHLAMGTHGVATIRALAVAHAESNQTLVAAPVLGRPDLAATG